MKSKLLKTLSILIFYAQYTLAGVPIVTSEYPPYVIHENNHVTGIVPDIVQAAFQELNIEVSFSIKPWVRGEHLVKNGEAYATFPYLVTQSRSDNFDFSAPVISFNPKFFYKKTRFSNGLFEWHNLEDFQPYVIGGVLGYWYEEPFKKIGLNVQYVVGDRQNLHKLMHDRIDFTLMDELVGWYLIHDIFPEKNQRNIFSVAPKPESSEPFHLMISRKYPRAKELTSTFNKGLNLIKKNSEYQKILNKYKMSENYSVP